MRAYFDDRPVEVACDILGVSQDAARDQMRAFEAAGYAERGGLAHGAGDNWWATTVKGNALAHASFGKPISRATATRLLGQVIERARAYNADPGRLLTVTEIVVLTYSTPEPSGFSIIASSDVRLGGEAGGAGGPGSAESIAMTPAAFLAAIGGARPGGHADGTGAGARADTGGSLQWRGEPGERALMPAEPI
jgi:hypothetical protein